MYATIVQSIVPWHEQIVAWLYGGVIAVLTAIAIFAVKDGYGRLKQVESVNLRHEKLLLSLDLTLKHIDEKLGSLLSQFGKHEDREYEKDKAREDKKG